MKTDTELQHTIMDELAWEPGVDAADIGVCVGSGIVTLIGTVKSLPQKWAAERAALRVSGVKAISDELVVKLPADAQQTDADIARAAVNALNWNASVPPNRIKVVVEHGVITLEGQVQFHYERVAAEHAVHNLIGARGVTNLISVVPPQASPGDIKHRIEKALERAAELDARRISVQAAEGKVVLRGSVKSWAERDEAEWAAWAAPGVSKVENDISVAP